MKKRHCPMCNGIVKPAIRSKGGACFWHCPECGYSGALVLEWEDEERMGSFSFLGRKNSDDSHSRPGYQGRELLIGLCIGLVLAFLIFIMPYLL